MTHFHADRESAIYTVSGETEFPVFASTDPEETESVVTVGIPRHLADLGSILVAVAKTP